MPFSCAAPISCSQPPVRLRPDGRGGDGEGGGAMETGSCPARLRRKRRPTNQVGHICITSSSLCYHFPLRFYTHAFCSSCSHTSTDLRCYRTLMLPDVQAVNGSLTFCALFLLLYSPGVLCTGLWSRLLLCKPYLDRGQALVLAG